MINFDTPIEDLSTVGNTTAKRLQKLGLKTAKDLLFYFPFRHEDWSNIVPVAKLSYETVATCRARVELIKNTRSFFKRKNITEALISDDSGSIKVVWFNQPYLAKILKIGDEIFLSGKVDFDRFGLHLTSPSYEKINREGETIHTARIIPIYSVTENLTEKQIRFLVKLIIPLAEKIEDWLPKDIKERFKLISLKKALGQIHFPDNKFKLEEAKRRLKFDELFLVQIRNILVKIDLLKTKAPKINFYEEETKKFVNSLPFQLTNAQRKAAWEILQDLENNHPMNRLLEGDVGSGKTVVAAIAVLNVILNGYQAVLMVPTEILAGQHFKSFCELFGKLDIKIGLLTRSNKIMNYEVGTMDRNGEKKLDSKFITNNSQLIIGTHALVQEGMEFNNLGLAIVDEQHRFGVSQRKTLTNADCTRTNTKDICEDEKLLYEDITYKIRGAIFTVKKELGLGHKENIYQKALEEEFKKNKLSFKKEVSINIIYDDKKIGVYRPDFIVEGKVILEIKSLPSLGKFEHQQVWHYLKGSDYQLALLANFGREDVQIERIIYTSPRKSAYSPQESVSCHFLSMTATPIPRTMSLIFYGDLDLSIIDEMPLGRKKVFTKIVSREKRNLAYDFVKQEIKKGRQVFIICPLIDPSDKLGVKSVKDEYEVLQKEIFPELSIGVLHGKMKSAEKEEVMKNFLENKINILVSTSVIEVGIDVPNATIMIIEGAERFGLAQLHQFRGRVGRSGNQSFCLLFSGGEGSEIMERLEALVNCNDGFALAEKDLALRGPGEVWGTRQSGILELKIASLLDFKIAKEAKEAAEEIIKKDPELAGFPDIKEKLDDFEKNVHLE